MEREHLTDGGRVATNESSIGGRRQLGDYSFTGAGAWLASDNWCT